MSQMSRIKVNLESTPILFLSSKNTSYEPTKNRFEALKINQFEEAIYVVNVLEKEGLILSDTFPHSDGFKILGKV